MTRRNGPPRDRLLRSLVIAAGCIVCILGPAPVLARDLALPMIPAPVPAVEAMREFSTDRPDKTESPFTVDAGHIQIEMDLATYTEDRTVEDGRRIRTRTVGVAPINFKYGTGRNSDLQLIVEPYVRRVTTDRSTGGRDVAGGFGDVTVRFKRNLYGNDDGDTALAIMPFVTVPTGVDGVGSGFVEGGVIVPLAIDLGRGIGLGLMTEVDLSANEGGAYAPSFVNSATIGFDLTDTVGTYAEVYTERGVASGSAWIVTLDAGVTYALAPGLQFDLGVNVGATRAADDVALFVGVSRRF